MIQSLRTPLFLVLLTLILAACGTTDEDIQVEEPVDTLYNKAADALDAGDYVESTKYFEEVERQHPYSKWATQAQLMAAFSSYQDQRYDEAILSLDRFIELHPGNPDIDYAYYLKALSYYEQISDVRRDQEMTKQSLEALNTLISRFPQSKYARDAILKRDLSEDHLAGKEMEVGRYYLGQGQFNAAINRFQEVIQKYQTTTHTPEALHRLVECYLSLGLKQQATRIASVLGYNYPGTTWYERSYALLDDQQRQQLDDERGVVERTLDSLLKPE